MSDAISQSQNQEHTATPLEAAVQDLQKRVASLEEIGAARKIPRKGSEAMRTDITNETLSTVKADLETVVHTVQSVIDGDTMTTACAKHGISYPKFQRFLNYARLPYNEKQRKGQIRLNEKEFSTWEERMYADMFNVPLGSGELVSLMPDDAEETIREALKSLPSRERQAIETLYEYEGTLEQASKIFGVTRERVRQIARSGLKKIRYRYGREMQCGAAAVERASLIFAEQKKAMIAELVEREKAKDAAYKDAKRRLEMIIDDRAHSIGIDDMGLSVRAYNVLAIHGERTLADVLAMQDVSSLLQMRNCGAKVADEIVDAVHKLGYKMMWE